MINGNAWTPTRQVVEKAASFITVPRKLFAIVAVEDKLKGIYIGEVAEAWEKAAKLSEKVHIIYKDRPYNTILGLAPEMVGLKAAGWNICVGDAEEPDVWVEVTSDGNCNKEPDWMILPTN